jgi:hypothetical protein
VSLVHFVQLASTYGRKPFDLLNKLVGIDARRVLQEADFFAQIIEPSWKQTDLTEQPAGAHHARFAFSHQLNPIESRWGTIGNMTAAFAVLRRSSRATAIPAGLGPAQLGRENRRGSIVGMQHRPRAHLLPDRLHQRTHQASSGARASLMAHGAVAQLSDS